MILLWLILTGLITQSTGTSNEVCRLCECTDNLVDCRSKPIKYHFNNSFWEEDKFHTILYENNDLVHLQPFPDIEVIHLSLRHNKIVKIDSEAFKNLKNLTILDLSANHLTSDNLLPTIFNGNYAPEHYLPIPTLKVLKLSDNSLHTLNEDLFESLPNLAELYLDSNPFRLIDSHTILAISSNRQLRVLDLSSMMLKDLPPLMFHTPKYLEVLNISSNDFQRIPTGIGEAHALEELVIDNNPIDELTDFPAIESLRILRMNTMPRLREIKNGSLSALTNLEELYCSYNPQLVRISGSSLRQEETKPAEGLTWPPIRKLYLTHNSLKYLDYDLLHRWDELEELDIQVNPWVCDCENQWLVSTLLPTMKNRNLNHTSGLRCHEPSQMSGESMAELSDKKYEMRCLDLFGNHPERDASVLVGIFIGILIAVPVTLILIVIYRRRVQPNISYSRAFYRKAGSLESFS